MAQRYNANGKKKDAKSLSVFDTGFDATNFVHKSGRSSPSLKSAVKRKSYAKQRERDYSSDSEFGHDELDLFSNDIDSDAPSTYDWTTAKENEGVTIAGKLHQFHPNYRPNTTLKSLKFKKTKDPQPQTKQLTASPSKPPKPSSAEPNSIKGFKHPKKPSANDTTSFKSTRVQRTEPIVEHDRDNSVRKSTVASKRTILPRPIMPLKHSSGLSEDRKFRSDVLPKSPVNNRQRLAEFPMEASPPKSSRTLHVQEFPLCSSPVSEPRDFPVMSPLSTSSPLRNGSSNDSDNSASSSSSSHDSTDTKMKTSRKKKSRDIKPFPLMSQLYESGTTTNREQRKCTEIDRALDSMDHMDSFDHDDSVLLPYSADPKTLCPYCDAPLPTSPTSHLRRLLSSTAKKAYPDPRPSNSLGLKAPLTVFGVVCQRHRFESQVFPLAEANGWPQEIDWQSLPKRIQKMKSYLTALIRDAPQTGKDNRKKSTPRSKCVFWKETMEQIKSKGSRAVTGMREQFATFEKAQPGYYGELGSVVIFQTLVNMFPPETFEGISISPFSVNEFIQRILLPEVATRLIMEDQSLSGHRGVEKAVSILRESSSYGVSMFPEDTGERNASTREADSGIKVGDLIVMERAKRRRKELEGCEEFDHSEQEVGSIVFDNSSPEKPPVSANKQPKGKKVPLVQNQRQKDDHYKWLLDDSST